LTPINTYSGVAQSVYQFLNVFKTAEGAPAPAEACINSAAAWSQGQN
jgi:hypothetical protein